MFRPRRIESRPDWSDPDGIKVYTVSARNQPVDQAPYFERLAEVKRLKAVAWASTPAFVVFHDGASCPYLILAWWGNDNELFTSVSAKTGSGWVEDASHYSFCVYDLEVFWHERNYFVQYMDCAAPDVAVYRANRFSPGQTNAREATHVDVTQLPFNRLVGLIPADAGSDFLVTLPDGPQYTNHLGTVHASALLAVAEAGSGAFLVAQLGDNNGLVPVVRRLEAKFRRPATGRVSARAMVAPDCVTRWTAELSIRGRVSADVPVEVVDAAGTVVLAATVEWFISKGRPQAEPGMH